MQKTEKKEEHKNFQSKEAMKKKVSNLQGDSSSTSCWLLRGSVSVRSPTLRMPSSRSHDLE